MSTEDLEIFLAKVSQLNEMIESLDKFPERKLLLSKCKSHDEVVKIAKSWGYEIGRRWGEGK